MSQEKKKRSLCLVDLCKNEGIHLFPRVTSLEEMRRKRIKAAKKAKLAKIKEVQSQIQAQNPVQSEDRLQNETQDIDASIKNSLKKVNKTLMKKDDRFKDVIGKITKIKRKAENVKIKKDVAEGGQKKKGNKGALKNK